GPGPDAGPAGAGGGAVRWAIGGRQPPAGGQQRGTGGRVRGGLVRAQERPGGLIRARGLQEPPPPARPGTPPTARRRETRPSTLRSSPVAAGRRWLRRRLRAPPA